jgi:predicted DNA-binding antitoxin AbrB/MazE fold protein
MAITVDAIFEDGQLKFKEPLALAQGASVRVTIALVDEGSTAQPLLRDHSAFLSSYAPEDEGLYDAYPAR